MQWPFKKIYITQKWGVNEDVYKRFGFKGHNGIDLRLFDTNGNRSSTSLVYAPHDGVVRERRFDADGYGNYLKIESDKEGSILGHLKEFKVNINKQVKEGDLIAVADNTGWSTGSHLHWGYYKLPRNRQNGYGGTIDPEPYVSMIDENTESDKIYTEEQWQKLSHENQDNWDKWQDALKKLVEYEQATETNNQRREVLAQNLGVVNDWDEIINASARFNKLDEDNLELQDKLERQAGELNKQFSEKEKVWEDKLKLVNLKLTDKEEELKQLKIEVNELIEEHQQQKEEKAQIEWLQSLITNTKKARTRFSQWIDSLLKIFKRK